MEESGQPTLHTEGDVSDYFIIESHILSTRSADAFKGVDKSRNSPVCIWMLRFPLTVNSEAVKRFLDRMYTLDQIDPPITDMLAYGVDAHGKAFSLFPSLDGHISTAGNIEPAEAERRFLACAKLIDKLHEHNIACGDLCASSFWLNREGDMRFLGTMGSFDVEAAATAMAPPVDTLPHLAPEQRAGGLELASDVFALGVLGYYLLTARYPYGQGMELMATDFDLANVESISKIVSSPPVWAEEVVMRCLNPDPSMRYQRAGGILHAVNEIRSRAFSEETTPVKKSNITTAPVSAGPVDSQVEAFQPTDIHHGEATEESLQKKPDLINRLALPIVLIGAIVTGGYIVATLLTDGGPAPGGRLQAELAHHLNAVTDNQLKDDIINISDVDAALKDKKQRLNSIVNSDDPVAHEVLVKSAREAETDAFRNLSEQAIIKRARRLELLRSAEQVRQWLRTVPRGTLPSDYEPILKCLDKSLPREARNSAIRQAYASNPKVAMRLAVALALDLGELNEFQPIISQLVGDSLKADDASSYSALSLILAHPDLSIIFGEDVIQKREQIPDKDLLWLLEGLAERNDINVRAIASMSVARGLLPPVREVFLGMIRDRGDLPADVLNSLIRAAAGVLKAEDIAYFGRWDDAEVPVILLAILADYSDPTILKETFDTLAARSVEQEPANSLIRWVRTNYWDDRAQFAAAVGILSNLGKVSESDIEKVFVLFDSYARDTDLLDILLDTEHPQILRLLVKRYSDELGLGELLNMLRVPDKEVRITAVRALKSYNDIGALKWILEAYEQERDPDVRKVYKETFWVISQREKGNTPQPR